MTAQSPCVIDALTVVQDDLALRLRTVVPAVEVSYDPTTHSATVQPAPKEQTPVGEFRAMAQIPNAPVVFPSGGGDAHAHCEVFERKGEPDRWL